MVGRTEEALQEEGVRYWKSMDRHLTWPTYRRIGMTDAGYKILIDNDGRILGAHIISDNASGLISVFRKAMIDGTDVEDLYREQIVSPYPSRESDLIYMLSPLLD
jgi:glutathione reductase (NADPH)